jgi:hypothetical protein
MNRITNAFVITACSVIIGWAGITAHNHYQRQYRENALDKCKKDKNYSNLVSLSENLDSGRLPGSSWVEANAKKVLDECLGKYGLKIKE